MQSTWAANVGWSRVEWSLVTISLHFHATSHPERQRLNIYLRKAKNWNSTRDSKRNLEYLHLPQAARRWGVPSQHKVLLLQPWLLSTPPEHNLYRVVFFNWPPLKSSKYYSKVIHLIIKHLYKADEGLLGSSVLIYKNQMLWLCHILWRSSPMVPIRHVTSSWPNIYLIRIKHIFPFQSKTKAPGWLSSQALKSRKMKRSSMIGRSGFHRMWSIYFKSSQKCAPLLYDLTVKGSGVLMPRSGFAQRRSWW